MKKLHVLLIGLCLLAAQCEQLPTFPLEEPFTLQVGEQKMASEDNNMVLHFSQVKEDSRCPTGVNCVWEGEVVTELILGKLGKDTLDLTFRPGREKASVGRSMGYHFRLIEVNPYPTTGVSMDTVKYDIVLEVKKE